MQSLSYRTDGKSHLVSNRDILGFSVMDKAKPLEIISLYVDVILSNSMTLSLRFRLRYEILTYYIYQMF